MEGTIIHVVEAFGGGIYDVVKFLVEELPQYEHVIIYGLRKETPENFKTQFPPYVKFLLWKDAQRKIHPIKDFKALLNLVKLLKSFKKPYVIHSHAAKAGFLARTAAMLTGNKHNLIHTIHSAPFHMTNLSKLKKNFYLFLERIASRMAGKVIAVSYSQAEMVKKQGIPAIAIPNCIECKRFEKFKDKVKENGKIKIGFSARASYQKAPWLFNQIAKYFKDNDKVEFVWIGGGELEYYLKSPNIRITGWLPLEKALEEMASLDIYLSTALWEGLSIAGLQAMCLEKPLIMKRIVGNIDLVKENLNGYLFDTPQQAAEYIKLLVEDPEKRLKMGKKSYEIVRSEFNVQKFVNAYKKLYQEILSSQ